jgi:hypothetical protein
MKRTESASSAQEVKKTQPEEFDLLILGGGTGSTIGCVDFCWRRKASRRRRAQIHRRLMRAADVQRRPGRMRGSSEPARR